MTPDNRNNEPLDAILRRAMRAEPDAATPECADAESLAAYSDRSLAASERERLEVHFADCMRCQVMLADVARADDSARDAKAASEVPWYRKWRIAIPALTAVAAVLVLIAIRRPANEEPRNNEVVAMAKREAPAIELAAPAPAPASPAVESAPAPAPAPPTSNGVAMNEARTAVTAKREALRMHHAAPAPAQAVAPAAPAAAPAPPPVDAGRVVAIAPAAPVVEPSSAAVGRPAASVSSELATNQPQAAPQRDESRGYAARELSSEAAAPGIGAMVAAPERAAPEIGGAAVGRSAGAIGGAAIGAGAGAIAGAAPGSGASAAGSAAGPIPGTIGQAVNPDKLPPGLPQGGLPLGGWTRGAIWPLDKSVTWLVGKNGTIQKFYANGAMRWQNSGVTTDLVAGSAPSATVCWIVGRSGTIIRTTDGEHWELITAPSKDNLTGVSASSASDATITTAGGQSFVTSDGGASWHPR